MPQKTHHKSLKFRNSPNLHGLKSHLWVCLIPHTQPLYHIITKTFSLLKQHSAHDIQHHHSTFKCLPQKSSENWNTTLRTNYLLILMLNYTNTVHFLGIQFFSFAAICTCYWKTLHDMLHGNMVLHHPPLCGDAHEQSGQRKISVEKQLSQLTALYNFQWASKIWESQKLCII